MADIDSFDGGTRAANFPRFFFKIHPLPLQAYKASSIVRMRAPVYIVIIKFYFTFNAFHNSNKMNFVVNCCITIKNNLRSARFRAKTGFPVNLLMHIFA